MAAIFHEKDDDKDSNTEKIETVIKEGWAVKESGQVVLGQTNWRRRFFRLVRLCRHQNGDVVVVWSYFRKLQDVNSNQPAGSIELSCEYVARELESGEKKRKPNCFALGPLYDRLSKRTYYVSCDNEEEKLTWMEVINAAAEIPSANAVKYEKRRNSIRKRMTRRSKKHQKTMEVCPVPTDSASYLDARWRLEQWKNLKAVVHSGQWKKSDVKNGISLSNMSFKRTDYAALKVEGIIPVHPGIAYDYLQRAFQPGGKLDQIFRNEKSLQTLDSLLPEATVVYNRYSVPLPGAAGRDACLMKMWVPMYLTGDGTCGLVIMSVSHPTVPQPKDTVRVQIELSGFVLSPIRNSSGSATHTRATVVSQIDLQDSLQSMLEGTFKSGLLKIGIRTAFSYISDQIQQFCAILQ